MSRRLRKLGQPTKPQATEATAAAQTGREPVILAARVSNSFVASTLRSGHGEVPTAVVRGGRPSHTRVRQHVLNRPVEGYGKVLFPK